MAFELRPLPFPKDSLGPTMSARTLDHHHGKHHATYVKKLNEFVAGTPMEQQDLEDHHQGDRQQDRQGTQDLQQRRAGVESRFLLGFARAQRRRHAAGADAASASNASFDSFDNFRDKFVEAAVDQFGSGWAWLVAKDGKLEITTTHDADNPLITAGSCAVDAATCGSTPTTSTTSRIAPASSKP